MIFECDFYFTIFHYIQPCVFVRERKFSGTGLSQRFIVLVQKIKLHTHYNNNNNNYWTRKNAFSAASPGMRI